MKNKFTKFIFSTLLVCLGGFANAGLIDFEDLNNGQLLYDGYGGLNWNLGVGDMYALNGTTYGASGYQTLANSLNGDIVTYNGWANSPVDIGVDSGTFTMNSMYIISAWDSVLSMTFSGFANGQEIYTMSMDITNTTPEFITFDWEGIDLFRINDSGQHFSFDNVTINEDVTSVSEPQTLAVLALSLVGLAARRRKAL